MGLGTLLRLRECTAVMFRSITKRIKLRALSFGPGFGFQGFLQIRLPYASPKLWMVMTVHHGSEAHRFGAVGSDSALKFAAAVDRTRRLDSDKHW